jgi:methyl-accepting chemotaxis protein
MDHLGHRALGFSYPRNLMFKIHSIGARLVISTALIAAAACGAVGWLAISQQTKTTNLALDREMSLQYQSVIAAFDGEGRTASAVASILANAVKDATEREDREEQGAATQEIARSVNQAADGTQDLSVTIGSVTDAANQTGAASTRVLVSAESVTRNSDLLRQEADRFVAEIRSA